MRYIAIVKNIVFFINYTKSNPNNLKNYIIGMIYNYSKYYLLVFLIPSSLSFLLAFGNLNLCTNRVGILHLSVVL